MTAAVTHRCYPSLGIETEASPEKGARAWFTRWPDLEVWSTSEADALGRLVQLHEADYRERVSKPPADRLDVLAGQIRRVFESSLSWENKYDIMFGERGLIISARAALTEGGVRFEYFDPDTTYEEDVAAFARAFEAHYTQALERRAVLEGGAEP